MGMATKDGTVAQRIYISYNELQDGETVKQCSLYLIEPLISCRLASTPASSARFASATSAAWIARRLSTSFSHAVHTATN